MRNKLISEGVTVGDIVEMNRQLTFNYADPEDNYFAVSEIRK